MKTLLPKTKIMDFEGKYPLKKLYFKSIID
jgi:hypothetical protein